MPDNVGAMFYYGDVPWHGKGRKLDKPADLHEALVYGELNWQVDMIPLQTEELPASPVKQRLAVVRSDCPPGHPDRVLGVVQPGFRPLQNEEGIELFDTLIGRKQRVYHTGGYLGNGGVVWVLARLPVDIKIRGADVVDPYGCPPLCCVPGRRRSQTPRVSAVPTLPCVAAVSNRPEPSASLSSRPTPASFSSTHTRVTTRRSRKGQKNFSSSRWTRQPPWSGASGKWTQSRSPYVGAALSGRPFLLRNTHPASHHASARPDQ